MLSLVIITLDFRKITYFFRPKSLKLESFAENRPKSLKFVIITLAPGERRQQ
jgi:hypothetical protein